MEDQQHDDENQLTVRDNGTRVPLATITIGNMFNLNGVWFRVTKVSENDVTLEPQGYTSKRLKELAREARGESKKGPPPPKLSPRRL